MSFNCPFAYHWGSALKGVFRDLATSPRCRWRAESKGRRLQESRDGISEEWGEVRVEKSVKLVDSDFSVEQIELV